MQMHQLFYIVCSDSWLSLRSHVKFTWIVGCDFCYEPTLPALTWPHQLSDHWCCTVRLKKKIGLEERENNCFSLVMCMFLEDGVINAIKTSEWKAQICIGKNEENTHNFFFCECFTFLCSWFTCNCTVKCNEKDGWIRRTLHHVTW